MSQQCFGPYLLNFYKADGQTPHARVELRFTTDDANPEQALTIDYLIRQLDDNSEYVHRTLMRRDMVYSFAHKIRSELKALGLLEHGEHTAQNYGLFLKGAWTEELHDKIRKALKIEAGAPIDLDRFLRDGD